MRSSIARMAESMAAATFKAADSYSDSSNFSFMNSPVLNVCAELAMHPKTAEHHQHQSKVTPMYHGALTNLNCANSATAHSENNSANRVSESELLGTIAESADASYHHFNGAAREVNFWAPPLTPPPRLNRIPRASTPTCWSAWLARPLRRWAMRRNIRRIERAIETLAVYMFTDQVEAEALKRQYKTSPTLAARRSADSLVLAGLNRDLVAAQLALAELDGQP